MASEIDICNLALSYLGQEQITSLLTPQTKSAQLCKLQYPLMRDAVLSEVEWTFASKRYTSGVPLVTSPEWGFTFMHQLSNDVIRVAFCSDNTDELQYNPDFIWVVEDRNILCDSETIYYRTINVIEDTTKFPPCFVQALAARLAAEMCLKITENLKLHTQLIGLYQQKMQYATTIDNMQGKAKRWRTGRLNAARGGY